MQVLPLRPQPASVTTHTGGPMRYLPGANEEPWFYPQYPPYIPPPAPPRGRWIWVPEDDGMCDACRRGGGVCGCVRPGRGEVVCSLSFDFEALYQSAPKPKNYGVREFTLTSETSWLAS